MNLNTAKRPSSTNQSEDSIVENISGYSIGCWGDSTVKLSSPIKNKKIYQNI